MAKQTEYRKPSRTVVWIGAAILLAAVGAWLTRTRTPSPPAASAPAGAETVARPVRHQPVIDYGRLEKDRALDAMMDG